MSFLIRRTSLKVLSRVQRCFCSDKEGLNFIDAQYFATVNNLQVPDKIIACDEDDLRSIDIVGKAAENNFIDYQYFTGEKSPKNSSDQSEIIERLSDSPEEDLGFVDSQFFGTRQNECLNEDSLDISEFEDIAKKFPN